MHLVATRSGNVPLKQMLALPADQCTLTSPVGEKKTCLVSISRPKGSIDTAS